MNLPVLTYLEVPTAKYLPSTYSPPSCDDDPPPEPELEQETGTCGQRRKRHIR
ncbi:MAG: hypothetical protein AAFO91_04735 [Bacteroidota bacterium]